MNKAVFVCLFGLGNLNAFMDEVFWNLSIGYRNDEVHCSSISYEADNSPYMQTKIHFTDIPIIQGGVLLGATVSDDWLLLANFNLGKVLDGAGQYTERLITFTNDESTAKITDGQSGDATLSVGYYPLFRSSFRLGPQIGWSYHTLTLKMPRVMTDFRDSSEEYSVHFKNHWQGPWLGISGSTTLWQAALYCDYEYHWPHWNASWVPVRGDVYATIFSDQRKGRKGNGQVARFGAILPVYCGWNFGVEGKYQTWKVTHGTVTPRSGSFAEVGVPIVEYEKLVDARWQSWQGQISVFYDY